MTHSHDKPMWPSPSSTPTFDQHDRAYLLGPAYMAHGNVTVDGIELDPVARQLLFAIACEGVVPEDSMAQTLGADPRELHERLEVLRSTTDGWVERSLGAAGGPFAWRLTDRGASALRAYLSSQRGG
jgi:hypothetical protein